MSDKIFSVVVFATFFVFICYTGIMVYNTTLKKKAIITIDKTPIEVYYQYGECYLLDGSSFNIGRDETYSVKFVD